MSQHKLELLAPAGNMNALEKVVAAGADAVYLGGKRFNMRLLRPEFNFSDQELLQAVDLLHSQGRKLYITVNNLYKEQEINEIKDYLLFLQEIEVDALIIQDLGLIKVCQELAINTPLHASVQMGINNLEAVKLLEACGFSRVILSKNLALEEITAIHAATPMGIEYFVHGDLCVSHTGQCFLSSFIFGESGNRGRCRKPCRWQYRLSGIGELDEAAAPQYYLAHKDLCLYPHLADIIQAGVSSFKIEGRMRSGEQLAFIVQSYRSALDDYLAHATDYVSSELAYKELEERRVRDYTSGSLFERGHQREIGLSGEREPVFPTAPIILNRLGRQDLTAAQEPLATGRKPEFTVKVGDLDSLQKMMELGVDYIVLGMDNMRQQAMTWNAAMIKDAIKSNETCSSKLLVETPRIVSQHDLPEIYGLSNQLFIKEIDGFIVNDLGSLKILKSLGCAQLWTGYGLNAANSKATAFLRELGITRISASLEMNADDLQLLLQTDSALDLLVQGPLPGIITDICLLHSHDPLNDACSLNCLNVNAALIDEYGQAYKIFSDYNCRNYVYNPLERSLYPYLAKLISWGVSSFRIDGQYYDTQMLAKVVSLYQEACTQIMNDNWDAENGYLELSELFPDGLTGMPLFPAGK